MPSSPFRVWSIAAEAAVLCGYEAGMRGAGAPGIETRPAILAFKLSCGTASDQDLQKQMLSAQHLGVWEMESI